METDFLTAAGRGRMRFAISNRLAQELASEQPDHDCIAQLLQILFNLHELTRDPHCRTDAAFGLQERPS